MRLFKKYIPQAFQPYLFKDMLSQLKAENNVSVEIKHRKTHL